MSDILTQSGLFAFLQVILIDLALAGDNAVVIGMAAVRVPKADRHKVIFFGLVAAVLLRLILALVVVVVLEDMPALMPIGGVLLLWVCWRMWRDIRESNHERKVAKSASAGNAPPAPHTMSAAARSKALQRAVVTVAVADLSMSLDNVLAVAGAAMHHIEVLVLGLLLSVALMGLAANLVAKLLQRFPWISYAGLFIVFYVAVKLIAEGMPMLRTVIAQWGWG